MLEALIENLRSEICRQVYIVGYRRELSNEAVIAKFVVDTAEKMPSRIWPAAPDSLLGQRKSDGFFACHAVVRRGRMRCCRRCRVGSGRGRAIEQHCRD